MRRSSSPRRPRRSNPTLGTGTTLAVLGVVALGGTLLYASMASARPVAPRPRPDPTPPPPAPTENPAATAAQPGAPATTGDDAPADPAAPTPEVSDNPVRTDASGAEQREFPDHVVAILAQDTALFTSPSNTDPARRRITTMRAGQRVNVRTTREAVVSRRFVPPASFVVSVYDVAVAGTLRDGYAAISRAELPPETVIGGMTG